MARFGGDLGQRHQDEQPPVQARVGENEPWTPAHLVAVEEQVDVEGAGPVMDPALPVEQDEVFTDVGYYFRSVNIQPFIRFEWNGRTEDIDKPGDSKRYGGGFNWYVTPAAQTMKITVGYERIVPKTKPATAKTKDTNHFLVQFQIVYF